MNIEIAKLHSKKMNLNIKYIHCPPEDLNLKNQFDVILNMEVVEHVSNVDLFIQNCSRLIKKNGIMFVATINKNLKSYIFAILVAEYFLTLILLPGRYLFILSGVVSKKYLICFSLILQ